MNEYPFLQLLLRKKAAEELKKEQERKAAERRRIIEERCGTARNLNDANEGKSIQIKHNNTINTLISVVQFVTKSISNKTINPSRT